MSESVLRIPADFLSDLDEDLLEKAVQAHLSHVQARTEGGRFRAGFAHLRPRVAGRFVRRLTREETAAAADLAKEYLFGRDGFGARMRTHLRDYQEKRIGPKETALRAERDIRHFYELAYRSGRQAVGDPAVILTPQDRAYLNALVKDESDYLRRFIADMQAGKGVMPYAERMELYIKAGREPAWAGWVLGDQSRGREIRWFYGRTEEHCRDCRAAVASGWMQVGEFVRQFLARGLLPHAGRLECHGIQCDCRLAERIGGREHPGLSF